MTISTKRHRAMSSASHRTCVCPYIILLTGIRKKIHLASGRFCGDPAGAWTLQSPLQRVPRTKANLPQIGSSLGCPPAYTVLTLITRSLAQSWGLRCLPEPLVTPAGEILPQIDRIHESVWCFLHICGPLFAACFLLPARLPG